MNCFFLQLTIDRCINEIIDKSGDDDIYKIKNKIASDLENDLFIYEGPNNEASFILEINIKTPLNTGYMPNITYTIANI